MPLDYQREIESIRQQIINKFNPLMIVLFGALDRGNDHGGSDIDLLIIQESIADRVDVIEQYYEEIDYNIPTNFIITTPQRYDGYICGINGLIENNKQKNLAVLYER